MLEQLRQIIEEERVPTLSMAQQLGREYPACLLPSALALRDADDDDSAAASDLRRFLAARLTDSDAIERFLGPQWNADGNFYPDPRSESHSTEDTIDSFLDKFSKSDAAAESVLIERQIFNPTADYAASFLGEDSSGAASGGASLSALAAGLAPSSAPEPAAAERPADRAPKGELSLSLANVMIKNRNYSKALEIIQAISLTNPEKSIYFADQIRFLKKLIINDNKS